MNILICGIGRVGLAIAVYFSQHHDKNVTIIDCNADLVDRLTNSYDITGVIGHASHPDTLERAGAGDADILIAVTDSDDVNIVCCQIAHHIFGVSKKIARIRSHIFNTAEYAAALTAMAVDVVISPEDEIAHSIWERMSVPGTTNDIDLVDQKVHVFGLVVSEENGLEDQTISDIYYINRQYDFRVFALMRDGEMIIPQDHDTLQDGDEIFIICAASCLLEVLSGLGNKNDIYKGHIVIAGGGTVSRKLCDRIMQDKKFQSHHLTVIEQSMTQARNIHQNTGNMLVLNGSALDETILTEANVGKASLFISVTNNNESNILGATLAKKMGAKYVIALNSNSLYNRLISEKFIDSVVNPNTVTATAVLRYIKHSNIKTIETIKGTGYDVVEAQLTQECGITNIALEDIKLPGDVKLLGAVHYDQDDLFFPTKDYVFKEGDVVIFMVPTTGLKSIESLFSFSISLF